MEVKFTWTGEVVSMIEKEKKYHIMIMCSGQLLEVSYLPEREEYRLGDKVLVRGHIVIDEIIKRNRIQDQSTDL